MAPAGASGDEAPASLDHGGGDGAPVSSPLSSTSDAVVAQGDAVVAAVSAPERPDNTAPGPSLPLEGVGTASEETTSSSLEQEGDAAIAESVVAPEEEEENKETAPPSPTPTPRQPPPPPPSTPALRKFLCAAPRPDQWDELLPPVLQRLGRPRAAASTLRQTIAAIQTRHALHPQKKRAGPGRKSNSVHALLFYQFLLDHVEAQAAASPAAAAATRRPGSHSDENDGQADGDETAESQDHSEQSEDNEGKDEDDGSENDEEKNGDKAEVDDDDDGEGEDGNPEDEEVEEDEEDDEDNPPRGRRLSDAEEVLAGGPLTAATDAEFAARHRTVCEVCEDSTSPQSLLMCATCPLAFHVACARPVLDDAPFETVLWQCAYCTLTTEPMYTKSRRTAAAAVRLMARLRNQHRRTRSSRRTGEEEAPSGATAELCPREPVVLIVRRGPAAPNKDESTITPKAAGAKSHNKSVVYARSPPRPSPDDTATARAPVEPRRSTTSSVSNEEPDSLLRSKGRAPKRPKLSGGDPASTAEAGEGEVCDVATSIRDVPATRASSTAGLAVGGGGSGSASSTPRKLQTELHKIADSLSPKSTKVEGGTLGKRVRKQPTLYNPQTVPASRWQSDEFPPRRDSDDDDGDDNSDVSSTTSKSQASKSDDDKGGEAEPLGERKARRGQGHSVWCNFCGDDPTIKVCCFCACRVCFGKQSQAKLLICDMCNDEYHTFCLDPPLAKVPSSDKWFCPSCQAAHEKRAARVSSRIRQATAAAPKARPKVDIHHGGGDADETPRRSSSRVTAGKKESDSHSTGSSKGSAKGSKRPRGRPRSVEGRKRGRPPSRSVSTPAPRKRGRPPKSRSPSSPTRPTAFKPESLKRVPSSAELSVERRPSEDKKRKRASEKPSVVVAASAELLESGKASSDPSSAVPSAGIAPESPHASEGSAAAVAAVAVPVKVSRSGRTVKRSSFHDEIDEGDQHLRSGRSSSSGEPLQPPQQPQPLHPPTKKGPIAPEAAAGDDVPTALAAIGAAEEAASPSSQPPPVALLDPYSVLPAVVAAQAEAAQGTAGVKGEDGGADASQEPMEVPEAPSMVLEECPDPSIPVVAPTEVVAPRGASDLRSSTVVESFDPYPTFHHPDAGASSSVGEQESYGTDSRAPRRKPGARECMQLSRRFGAQIIADSHVDVLLDYCKRGKVEHLIRMRERLDDHARFLESQLAALESLALETGVDPTVRPAPVVVRPTSGNGALPSPGAGAGVPPPPPRPP